MQNLASSKWRKSGDIGSTGGAGAAGLPSVPSPAAIPSPFISLFKESSSGTADQEPLFRLPTRTVATIRTPIARRTPTDDIKGTAALANLRLDPKQIILRHIPLFGSESTIGIPLDTNHQKDRALIDTLTACAPEQELPVDIHLSKANQKGSFSFSQTTGSKPTPPKETLQSSLLPDMSDMIPRSTSRTDVATSNPWQNLVKEFDPDNSMEDGRSYVGKASHLVDKPAAPRGGRGGYSGGYNFPTREMTRAGPSVSPQRPRPPPQPQRQAQPAPRGPPSYRPQSKHRWSGQSLATANSLPPGFFATAKPRVPAPESLAPDRQTQVRPRPPPPTDPQQWSNIPPSRVFKGPTQAETPEPEPQPQPQTLPSARGPLQVKQIQTPVPTSPSSSVHERQEQPIAIRPPPQPVTPAGGALTANTGHSSVEIQRSSTTSHWGTGPTTVNTPRHRSESLIDLTEDETMTIYSSGSERDSIRRPSSSRQGFSGGTRDRGSNNKEVPAGDPVVFQYPLADGHWATLALYVDRDARSAQLRFSDIRTRQMSDIKKKSPDDVGKIVAKVIQETVAEDE